MASSSGDIERGQSRDFRRGSRISRASLKEDYNQLDEYGKLVKYVSTFQAGDADQLEDGEYEEQRLWYAPWKTRRVRVRKIESEAGKFPEAWLTTDIRQGLSADQIPQRRQRAGWNELVSEKENPIAKVLSYFQGPILYGKLMF